VARGDLTYEEWAVLAPLLPAHPVQGRRWRDHRQVSNAIWRDLPERYGSWKTPYQRFRRWAADGTWARVKAQVVTLAELDDDIDRDAQIDATIVRAPQHAARAAKKGVRCHRHAGTRTGTDRPPAMTSPAPVSRPLSIWSKCSTGSVPYPTTLI